MGGIDPGGLAVAIGGAIASVIGAWALYTRARIAGGSALHVLRRLWDWVETTDLDEEVPPTLARDVKRELSVNSPQEGTDDPAH
jgi:hypothetical protein